MVLPFVLQVQNVRVHVYRPHRNCVFVSTLIVWDSCTSNRSQIQYAINAYTAEGLPLTTVNAWESLGATFNVGVRGTVQLNLLYNGCVSLSCSSLQLLIFSFGKDLHFQLVATASTSHLPFCYLTFPISCSIQCSKTPFIPSRYVHKHTECETTVR